MLKNIRIRTRLFIGFSVLLVLLVCVSIFSVTRMSYLAGFTANLYEHPLRVSNAVRDVHINIVNMQRVMRELLLSDTAEQLSRYEKEVDEYEVKVNKDFDNVQKYILLDDKSKINDMKKRFAEWKPIRDEEIKAMRQKDRAKAIDITNNTGKPYIENLTKEMKSLIDFASQKADDFYEGAKKSEQSSYIVVGIFDVIAVFISILIAYWITLSITRPVDIAAGIADRLASGDISMEIPEYSRDEMGSMLGAMKNMAENLRTQMRLISEGINVLAGSAAEISVATSQFASTTQEVATSVNQVVVSMKEVKQTTILSTDKAREMAERARSVVEVSRSGEAAVRQTIEVIDTIQEQMLSIADSVVGLSDQSQSIGEIIAAVDDVADQSRLLAVNASIEAVKAGEQGKGFTVVADEIKNLAEQSKQSTSQVRTILTDIQKATSAAVMATEKGSKAVENGVRQANQTGSAIQALGGSIEQTSQSAVQIEATNRQQAAGIDQVFAAMESINSAISQNAESAKQLQNSARDLDELGRKLKTIVDKYKI
jgi:methyl-accepting chemotaxis protein